MAIDRSNEDRTKKFDKGVEPMNAKEIEALQHIKESLEEFPDCMMAQYIQAEDLKTLVKFIERSTKKPCDK